MTRLFEKTYPDPGVAPGHGARAPGPAAEVRAWQYREQQLEEYSGQSALEQALPTDGDGFVWIHLQGVPSPGQLEQIGTAFGLHPLALEDVRHQGQRPKVDYFDSHAVIILNQPGLAQDGIILDQVNLFVGARFVISIHAGEQDPFTPVRQRMRSHSRSFNRLGAPYLAYALADVIVDQAFPLMERLGERIEELEESVLANPGSDTLAQVHTLRRELLVLRRQWWPTRDVFARLLRDDVDPFGLELAPWLRDIHDHTIQIMDLLESYREMATSLTEAYLSAVNQRSNDVIRVLTIIATIFIPLTFLVGVYGMNFAHPDSPWSMPELYTYYGYPVLWGFMLAVVALMLYLFRRRGWL